MRLFVVILGIACLLYPALLFWDIGWLIYLALIPLLLRCWAGASWRVVQLAGFIIALIITCHFLGFRIYGSPSIFDNDPLLGGERIIGFEPPNVLFLESGEKIILEGYQFNPAWKIREEEMERMVILLFDERSATLDPESKPLMVCFSKHYWCGNTFFPRFFPRRLPRYEVDEFNSFLQDRGAGIFEPA